MAPAADVESGATIEPAAVAPLAEDGEALSESTAAQIADKITPARKHIDESPADPLILRRCECLSYAGARSRLPNTHDVRGTSVGIIPTETFLFYGKSDCLPVRIIVLPRVKTRRP